MKVAVFSEWTADEASLSILLPAIMNGPVEVSKALKTRPGGWTHVIALLPQILHEIYYASDVEGLIVVLDSDFSPVHQREHELPNQAEKDCRLCKLIEVGRRTLCNLESRAGDRPVPSPLHLAFGLAVPSIEAWCLCGDDRSVSEATWNNSRKQNQTPYTVPDLKRRLYKSDRATVSQKNDIAIKLVQRQANDRGIEHLTSCFPIGFGTLVRMLKEWPATPLEGTPS